MVGITDEVCQVESRNLIATSQKQTLSVNKPTFISSSATYHPSCWYTIGIEEYKWVNEKSKIKLIFEDVTSTAEITLFTGTGLENITDYIQTNGTVTVGAPYYFDVENPPFIVLGHKKSSSPGSFNLTYEVIGT